MITLTNERSDRTDKFWDIAKDGETVATLYHPTRAFAPWFVSIWALGVHLSRYEFKTKAAAMAFAAVL